MNVSSTRFAACLVAAAVLTACSAHRTAESGGSPGATLAPARSAAPAARAASGPGNGLVTAAGTPAAPTLTPEQRAELDRAAAGASAALRPRLRYALAAGDDGKTHLIVYDGQGLPADGRHPGKPHEYVIFKVLNALHGEHYDPQQNYVIAAIPPPPERDSAPQ